MFDFPILIVFLVTILYFCEKQNTKEENTKTESHTLKFTNATEEWLVGNYIAPQIELVNKLESKPRHELNQECHKEQSKNEYKKFQEDCKKQSEEYDKRRKKERKEDEERRKKDEERRRKRRLQLF